MGSLGILGNLGRMVGIVDNEMEDGGDGVLGKCIPVSIHKLGMELGKDMVWCDDGGVALLLVLDGDGDDHNRGMVGTLEQGLVQVLELDKDVREVCVVYGLVCWLAC